MNSSPGENKFPRKWGLLLGAGILFLLCVIPLVVPISFDKAALYYGSFFFVVLLAVSIALLLYVPARVPDKSENRDFRVIHFMLRSALTFGIGAVLMGVLLIVFLILSKFYAR